MQLKISENEIRDFENAVRRVQSKASSKGHWQAQMELLRYIEDHPTLVSILCHRARRWTIERDEKKVRQEGSTA